MLVYSIADNLGDARGRRAPTRDLAVFRWPAGELRNLLQQRDRAEVAERRAAEAMRAPGVTTQRRAEAPTEALLVRDRRAPLTAEVGAPFTDAGPATAPRAGAGAAAADGWPAVGAARCRWWRSRLRTLVALDGAAARIGAGEDPGGAEA